MRLAFVIPRYGDDIAGGAEKLARDFAHQAVSQGWQVEVWTTCAYDHRTWENALPEGVTHDGGVLVRRFPISSWNHMRQGAIITQKRWRDKLPVGDEYEWVGCGPHSVALYEHVAQHAEAFDFVVALPYLMAVVYHAAWVAPHKTILWPCLHDETFAYMEPFRLLLENMRGVIFNSLEEQSLAVHRLRMNLPRHAVVGVGVPDYVLPQPRPPVDDYLLYIGRLEDGKNLELLYHYMVRSAEDGHGIKLKMIGQGSFLPPPHPAIEVLGFVSDEEKMALAASALAVCQPSRNESFSLAIMEAWLVERPVLVHARGKVTRGHVRRSKGGLWFEWYHDFVEAVAFLRQHPQQAAEMGRNGRVYVLQHYRWPAVMARFEAAVADW
jgi:glycosyltransferase involved in cell wall biosynthesis